MTFCPLARFRFRLAALAATLALVSPVARAARTFGTPSTRSSQGASGERPVAVADANGDGIQDLLWITGGTLEVALGDGAGNFGSTQPTDTGLSALGGVLAVGDLNGDGKADVVIGPAPGGNEAVELLATGGGLYVPITLSLPRASGQLPFLGDVDGDGDLDAVFVDQGFTVFLNAGGVLSQALDQPGLAAQDFRASALADMDGNGSADLVIRSLDGDRNTLDVFYFRWDPSTSSLFIDEREPLVTGLANDPLFVVADMDADGDRDIALDGRDAGDGSPAVRILRNGGARVFTQGSTAPSVDRGTATDMIVADLDGDNLPDVAIGCSDSSCRTLVVHRGVGQGNLSPPLFVPILTAARHLVAADLDCDGDLDLLAAGPIGVSIGLNRGGLVFDDELAEAFPSSFITTAFLDADAQRDLVGISSINVATALGQGCVQAGQVLCQGASPQAKAGNDQTVCAPPFTSVDVPLSGQNSLPASPAAALDRYCWTTDLGSFVESGIGQYCSAATTATLRVPTDRNLLAAHVTLEVTDINGCRGQQTLTVSLSPQPAITLAESSSDTVCGNGSVDLIAVATDLLVGRGLITLSWDFDLDRDSDFDGDKTNDVDGTVVAVSGALAVVTASYPGRSSGPITARVTAQSENGTCTSSADVTFNAFPVPQIVQAAVPPYTCPGVPVTMVGSALASSGPSPQITWDFDTAVDSDGDGNPSDDVQASGTTATWTFATGGTHVVRMRAVGQGGCQSFVDKPVSVFASANQDFTATGSSCTALVLDFHDQTTGITPAVISWSFGDGSPDVVARNASHLFPSGGSYSVTETIIDSDNCTFHLTKSVGAADISLALADVRVHDGDDGVGSGNGNGFPEPGETIVLDLQASNAGPDTASGVTATVTVVSPVAGVDVVEGTTSFQPIAAGATVASDTGAQDERLTLSLNSNLPCGTPLVVTVTLIGENNLGCTTSKTFTLPSGVPGVVGFDQERLVGATSGDSSHPCMAGGGGVHATVFEDNSSGRSQIFFARQDGNAVVLSGPDDISLEPGTLINAHSPRIAWDPVDNQLGVVWQAVDDTARSHVAFARIASNGQIVGSPVSLGGPASPGDVDVCWAGRYWVAAWTDGVAVDGVKLQAIDANGLALTTPVSVLTSTSLNIPERPRLASDGVVLVLADQIGASLSVSQLTVPSPSNFASIAVTGTQSVSLVASNDGASLTFFDGRCLIAWGETSGIVRTTRLRDGGTLEPARTLDTGSGPQVAASHDMAAVAYVRDGLAYARGIDVSGRVFSDALLVSPGSGPARQAAISALENGLFLVTWSDYRGNHPQAADIYSRIVQPSTTRTCTTGFLLGDLAPAPDGDGRVDIRDVVQALRYAVELDAPTTDAILRGDVAPGVRTGTTHRVIGDGIINIGDVVVLLQVASGTIHLTR